MAETMKAAFIKQVGPAENIIYGDIPKPKIDANQVLVKVKAVDVNHVDTYIRSGQYSANAPFPFIIGLDMVGMVESVGKNVKSFKPGQKVWTNNMGIQGHQGTYSEYVAVDQDLLYHLPEGVDEIQAISVIHSATTACMGLIRMARLNADETIFINGGSGNVGSAIIQFANTRNAKVITTAGSQEKADWCKKIGASDVINYKTQNVAQEIKKIAPQGIDVFWDTTRQPNLEQAVDLLSRRGRIVLMAGFNAHPTFPVGPFYSKECSMFGFTILNVDKDEMRGYADIINAALEQKILTGKVAQKLPLSEAAKAHKLLETDKNLWGKIILTVS